MGGEMTGDRTCDKEEILAIKTAIRLGMTHIDTAELYGNGHAEELVGEAIEEFDRDKLFITTKVKWSNLKYQEVIAAAKRSLKRLKTNYIDLYLVHTPNSSIPIEETMKAMDYVAKNELARFIGVSNFSVEQMKEAQQHAENRIVANQIEYNLLVRDSGLHTKDMESKIIPYCQKNDIAVIAYRPLAYGQLAKPGIPLLDELAEKYKKTPAQIAINWLISKPNVVTIPKAVKIEHIKENLGAIGWHLGEEDMHRLDHDFPIKAY
jgi:diketogulonate reductase-like aldo/keto reductase